MNFDNAIWLGIGIAGFPYHPRKVRRDIGASPWIEEQGTSGPQIVRTLYCFAIGMGVLRIFGFYRDIYPGATRRIVVNNRVCPGDEVPNKPSEGSTAECSARSGIWRRCGARC